MIKNKKKDILINKYNKVNIIKKLMKIHILNYFIQNNNLSLTERSLFSFLKLKSVIKKKKNLCLITSRKKSTNRFTNLSRLSFRRLARYGYMDNFKIN